MHPVILKIYVQAFFFFSSFCEDVKLLTYQTWTCNNHLSYVSRFVFFYFFHLKNISCVSSVCNCCVNEWIIDVCNSLPVAFLSWTYCGFMAAQTGAQEVSGDPGWAVTSCFLLAIGLWHFPSKFFLHSFDSITHWNPF